MPDFATDLPGNRAIAFAMQPQEKKNWCWAANTASIANCYAGEPVWTQCAVAGRIFNRPCCPRDVYPECDEDSYLDVALKRTQNLAAEEQEGPLTTQAIKDQIDQRRLIGIRIRWANGFGGHFLTIHGYNINAGMFFVYVKDPQRPSSVPYYNELVNHYQGAEGARWSHTYLTRPTTGDNQLEFAFHDDLSMKIGELAAPTKVRKMENKAHFKTQRKHVMLPHDIYNIPFISLIASPTPQPSKTGHRLIDASGKDGLLLFDFDNAQSNAGLQQIINDNAFVEQYDQVIRSNQKRRSSFVLRLLRVPELASEALWFHREEKPGDDYVITLNTAGSLSTEQRLPLTEFMGALHQSAIAKRSNPDKRYE